MPTVVQLRHLCRAHGLRCYSRLRKRELEKLLESHGISTTTNVGGNRRVSVYSAPRPMPKLSRGAMRELTSYIYFAIPSKGMRVLCLGEHHHIEAPGFQVTRYIKALQRAINRRGGCLDVYIEDHFSFDKSHQRGGGDSAGRLARSSIWGVVLLQVFATP